MENKHSRVTAPSTAPSLTLAVTWKLPLASFSSNSLSVLHKPQLQVWGEEILGETAIGII